MIRFFIASILFFAALSTLNCGKDEVKLKIGEEAPDFELPDDAGIRRSLSDFRGKKVAIYFYPKNDTPGCTRQACSIRDGYQQLTGADIVILGISYDSPESHRKFKEKHDLPFTLLSDEKKEVAMLYGASWGILGNLFLKRQTYLIDEEGRLIKILRGVDVNQHAQEILDAFHTDI